MKKQELYNRAIAYFEKAIPNAQTELHFESPFELVVAVMLSAQCTDKRVNMVTPALLAAYPTPFAMSQAQPEDLLAYMGSVSYPNSKANHLIGMSRMLIEKFGGIVPDSLEELTQLPGVGRKTANVVQMVAFNKATMAVDTHVFRVSHRLGLVSDRCTTPLSVEKELMKNIPTEKVTKAHHWLILHGRYTCTARNPKCLTCGLQDICKYALGKAKRSKEESQKKEKSTVSKN
jgi:endonuclease-3